MILDILTVMALAALADFIIAKITGRGLFDRLHDVYQAFQDTKYNRDKDLK